MVLGSREIYFCLFGVFQRVVSWNLPVPIDIPIGKLLLRFFISIDSYVGSMAPQGRTWTVFALLSEAPNTPILLSKPVQSLIVIHMKLYHASPWKCDSKSYTYAKQPTIELESLVQ